METDLPLLIIRSCVVRNLISSCWKLNLAFFGLCSHFVGNIFSCCWKFNLALLGIRSHVIGRWFLHCWEFVWFYVVKNLTSHCLELNLAFDSLISRCWDFDFASLGNPSCVVGSLTSRCLELHLRLLGVWSCLLWSWNLHSKKFQLGKLNLEVLTHNNGLPVTGEKKFWVLCYYW